MKDEYFEIVQQYKTWLSEKLTDYSYDRNVLLEKADDLQYVLTDREKEGLALAKEMLDRITNNVLISGG